MTTTEQLAKAAETTRVAHEIINNEAEARRRKSERLRDARMAAERSAPAVA